MFCGDDTGAVVGEDQSIHWNAELLNKLITRVNAIEAAAKLAVTETTSHHEGVNDLSIVRDKKFRDELDVTIKALQVDFERLEKAGAPAPPTSVPDLGKTNEKFEQLQQQVSEGAAKAGRVDGTRAGPAVRQCRTLART